MRHIWVLLMLCTASASIAAECVLQPRSGPSPAALSAPASPPAALPEPVQTPTALKVNAPQRALLTTPQAAQAATWQRWRDHPLGAPLLVSVLAMLVIAWRRGSR